MKFLPVRQYVRNVAKAIDAGLSRDAAVRALTIDAARIAGVVDRVGSVERGRIANLIVPDGDLFDEQTAIRHVFIDGREIAIDALDATERAGAARRSSASARVTRLRSCK